MKLGIVVFLALLFLPGCGLLDKSGATLETTAGQSNKRPVSSSKERLTQRASLQTQLFALGAQKLSLENELDGDRLISSTEQRLKLSHISINELLIRTEIVELNHQIEHLEAQLNRSD